MSTPTPTPRATTAKRRRANDIQRTACELVIAHGYDGFTMAELADAVGVSRRTLFNYFPDKQSAVLGCVDPAELPAAEVFRAGGPTGHLTQDITQTLEAILTEDFGSGSAAAEHHKLVEQAIASDPKLMSLALRRFEEVAQLYTRIMCERQGWPADDLRARTFAATFLALIKVSFDELSRRTDESEFIDVFREVLAADTSVRELSA